MLTALIVWIIVGLIAGALGKLIMPRRDPGGVIVTILIGMAGALVGGFIMQGLFRCSSCCCSRWSLQGCFRADFVPPTFRP